MRLRLIISILALLLPSAFINPQEAKESEASDFVIGLNAFNHQILDALEDQPTRRVIVLPFADLEGSTGRAAHYITEQLITAIAATRDFQILDSSPLVLLAKEAGVSPLDLPNSEEYGRASAQYARTSIIVGAVTDLGSRISLMARILKGESGQIAGAAQVYLAMDDEIKALMMIDRESLGIDTSQEKELPEEKDAEEETIPERMAKEESQTLSESDTQTGETKTDMIAEAVKTTTDRNRDDEALYQSGRDHFEAARYDRAQETFERFLSKFPDSPLADNAVYWIGECYYRQKQMSLALANFQRVLKDYPYGNKVPSAMLKIGYTLEQLGQTDKAIETLEQLIGRFGDTEEAERGRHKLQLLRAAKQS